MSTHIKPSEQVKAAGIKSLNCVEAMTGVPTRTLINWHSSRPALFSIIVEGCAAKMKREAREASAAADW